MTVAGGYSLDEAVLLMTLAGVALDPIDDLLFLYEAGLQHGSATYLSLLGTAPMFAASAKLQGVVERATQGALATQTVQLPSCELS